MGVTSFQVGADSFNQLGGASGAFWINVGIGVHDVVAYVIFHHLGGQALDGATERSDQHQHVGTADFRLKRALDGLDLSLDAADAGNQLGFVFDRMGHPRI
jgi:hypothetical protein